MFFILFSCFLLGTATPLGTLTTIAIEANFFPFERQMYEEFAKLHALAGGFS